MIDSAAPNPAAAEIPNVYGLARGLASTVCINRPASARLAPTTNAVSVIGKRIDQKTT